MYQTLLSNEHPVGAGFVFQRSVVRAPAQYIFHSKKQEVSPALAVCYISVVFLNGVVLRRLRYGGVRRYEKKRFIHGVQKQL